MYYYVYLGIWLQSAVRATALPADSQFRSRLHRSQSTKHISRATQRQKQRERVIEE